MSDPKAEVKVDSNKRKASKSPQGRNKKKRADDEVIAEGDQFVENSTKRESRSKSPTKRSSRSPVRSKSPSKATRNQPGRTAKSNSPSPTKPASPKKGTGKGRGRPKGGKKSKQVTFVTGNENKLKEVKAILGDEFPLVSKDVDCKLNYYLFEEFQFLLICNST